MTSAFIKHITRQDERWDHLAWNYYGDPTLYGPIIQANPSVPISGAFDAGIVIQIPILQKASDVSNDTPPWGTL